MSLICVLGGAITSTRLGTCSELWAVAPHSLWGLKGTRTMRSDVCHHTFQVCWGLDETESQLTSMAESWRHSGLYQELLWSSPWARHLINRFKKSQNWCYHYGATQYQYNGCWMLVDCIFIVILINSILLVYRNLFTPQLGHWVNYNCWKKKTIPASDFSKVYSVLRLH